MTVTNDQLSTEATPALPSSKTGVPAVDSMLERTHAGVNEQVPFRELSYVVSRQVAAAVGGIFNMKSGLDESWAQTWNAALKDITRLRKAYQEEHATNDPDTQATA